MPVEMRTVFSPQGAPELFPAFCLLNQLNESRDGSPHSAPQTFRSGRKERNILLAGKGKLVVGSGFHLYDVFGLAAKSHERLTFYQTFNSLGAKEQPDCASQNA